MRILSTRKLAETVRRLREEKGYTKIELSDLTGIKRALISRIESEDFIPSVIQFEALYSTLGFNPSKVFVEKENTNSFSSLRSEALSDSEREGLDKLFNMMLTLRQQISIRRAYENEKSQT